MQAGRDCIWPRGAGGITFQTLRHWFSTRLEDLSVSKTVRRDLLGHAPKDITDDYTHSTIEMRRRAVALLCQTFSESFVTVEEMSGKVWQAPEE